MHVVRPWSPDSWRQKPIRRILGLSGCGGPEHRREGLGKLPATGFCRQQRALKKALAQVRRAAPSSPEGGDLRGNLLCGAAPTRSAISSPRVPADGGGAACAARGRRVRWGIGGGIRRASARRTLETQTAWCCASSPRRRHKPYRLHAGAPARPIRTGCARLTRNGRQRSFTPRLRARGLCGPGAGTAKQWTLRVAGGPARRPFKEELANRRPRRWTRASAITASISEQLRDHQTLYEPRGSAASL